jgi:hypothetical protein
MVFGHIKWKTNYQTKDLVVTFVVRIEDVTTKVLEGTAGLASEAEKQKKIQENISTLKNSPKEAWQENTY